MKYKGAVIADIHIGAIPINKLETELESIFFENLRKSDKLDFIIIDGDTFHKKVFLNDDESKYAFVFANKLKEIAMLFPGLKIRIVYGTDSHDSDQYDCILKPLKDLVDIRLIKHVSDEELFPDLNILYIPEEYVMDKAEYYKEYFDCTKKYNYVFGHGIIREVMKEAATMVENKGGKRKKVPTFSTAELRKICKGETYFGHYHVHTEMDGVYYVGSFSRWQHGEEEDKGFYIIEYNDKKESYKNEFIVNTMCSVYKTITFGYDNAIFDNTEALEKSLDRADEIVKTNSLENIRFIFNIPEDYENPEYMMNYIKERYKFNNQVKIDLTNGYVKTKKVREEETIDDKQYEYDFIFDEGLDMEYKVHNFISLEYGKEIDPNNISIYLYKPLKEILNSDIADE